MSTLEHIPETAPAHVVPPNEDDTAWHNRVSIWPFRTRTNLLYARCLSCRKWTTNGSRCATCTDARAVPLFMQARPWTNCPDCHDLTLCQTHALAWFLAIALTRTHWPAHAYRNIDSGLGHLIKPDEPGPELLLPLYAQHLALAGHEREPYWYRTADGERQQKLFAEILDAKWVSVPAPDIITVPAHLHFAEREQCRCADNWPSVFREICAGNLASRRRPVQRTGEVNDVVLYGCPEHWDAAMLRSLRSYGPVPPASLYDQTPPENVWHLHHTLYSDRRWKGYRFARPSKPLRLEKCLAEFDWDTYVQNVRRLNRANGKDKGWIRSQHHHPTDPNLNCRARYQYRDWMFWTGSVHASTHTREQLTTERRTFWAQQGGLDACIMSFAEPGYHYDTLLSPERSKDFQAEIIYRLFESVRRTPSVLRHPYPDGGQVGEPALSTDEHLPNPALEERIEASANAISQLRSEYTRVADTHTALTSELRAAWEARLQLEEDELVAVDEHNKGIYRPEGYSDRIGMGLCVDDKRYREQQVHEPWDAHRTDAWSEVAIRQSDDEQQESEEARHLNSGSDYISHYNQRETTDEIVAAARKNQDLLDWIRRKFKIKEGDAITPELKKAVLDDPDSKSWAYQVKIFLENTSMAEVNQQQDEQLKSNTLVKSFSRSRKRLEESARLADYDDPEFHQAHENWWAQLPSREITIAGEAKFPKFPIPGGWFVALALKENHPMLYPLNVPAPFDSDIPALLEVAFEQLHQEKRAQAEHNARRNGHASKARKRVDDVFDRAQTFYLLPRFDKQPSPGELALASPDALPVNSFHEKAGASQDGFVFS